MPGSPSTLPHPRCRLANRWRLGPLRDPLLHGAAGFNSRLRRTGLGTVTSLQPQVQQCSASGSGRLGSTVPRVGTIRAASLRPPECSLLKPPHWPLEGCGWPVLRLPPNTPHQQRRRGLQTANCCKRLASRLGTGLTPPSTEPHHSLLLRGHPGASRQMTRPVVEKSLPQIRNKDTVPARRPPPASSPKEESKMGSGGPSRWQPVSPSLELDRLCSYPRLSPWSLPGSLLGR